MRLQKSYPILIPLIIIVGGAWSASTWLLPLLKAAGHIDWPWWVSFLPLMVAIVIALSILGWIYYDKKKKTIKQYVVVAGSLLSQKYWEYFVQSHRWDIVNLNQRFAKRNGVRFQFCYTIFRLRWLPKNTQYMILPHCEKYVKDFVIKMYPEGQHIPEKEHAAPQYVLDALRVMAETTAAQMGHETLLHNNGTPFMNHGSEIETSVFHCEAYSWDEDVYQAYNFRWRDLLIEWYKHCNRSVFMNRKVSEDECAEMLKECLKSLEDK